MNGRITQTQIAGHSLPIQLIPGNILFFSRNHSSHSSYVLRFLMDLEHRIEKSILISDVCDIVYNHAVEHFSVFIKYVINQVYQEKNYRRISWVFLIIIYNVLHSALSSFSISIGVICSDKTEMKITYDHCNTFIDWQCSKVHLCKHGLFHYGTIVPQWNILIKK